MKNFIHETAIISENVELGVGNYIGPYCKILGPAKIGDHNYFDSFVSLGSPPQDDYLDNSNHISFNSGINAFGGQNSLIRIGSNNIFREFVTIHKPTLNETIIGNSCYLMAYSHIPHDCIIKERVKIANNVQIGGFTIIHSDSYIGLSAVVLQFSVVGGFSMVGMNSTVTRNVFPGSLIAGSPAKFISPNKVKLSRITSNFDWWENYKNGFDDNSIPALLLNLKDEYQIDIQFNVTRRDNFNRLRASLSKENREN